MTWTVSFPVSVANDYWYLFSNVDEGSTWALMLLTEGVTNGAMQKHRPNKAILPFEGRNEHLYQTLLVFHLPQETKANNETLLLWQGCQGILSSSNA